MKLDARLLRHLSKDDFRVLSAVEQGMKNHALVPTVLIVRIAGLSKSLATKSLSNIARLKLVWHDSKVYDGYKLTYGGYDFLALRALNLQQFVTAVGPQIGVGKESDIYMVEGGEEAPHSEGEALPLVLKLQRLGRVSFRAIKEKRDYLGHRSSASWLYMSRLGAVKEFAFMKALHAHDFPVPEPVAWNRHAVVMTQVDGTLLNRVGSVKDTAGLYSRLMEILVRLGRHGLIHCDFNEYNIMLGYDDETITVIDFPQMVSTSHTNAEFYFDRDVQCVRTFFSKRFSFEAEDWPRFQRDVIDAGKIANVDITSEASGYGFTPEDEDRFLELSREAGMEAHSAGAEEGDERGSGSDSDESGLLERSSSKDASESDDNDAGAQDVEEHSELAVGESGGVEVAEGSSSSSDEVAEVDENRISGAAPRNAVHVRTQPVDDAQVRKRVTRTFKKKNQPKFRRNVQKNKTRKENNAAMKDF